MMLGFASEMWSKLRFIIKVSWNEVLKCLGDRKVKVLKACYLVFCNVLLAMFWSTDKVDPLNYN